MLVNLVGLCQQAMTLALALALPVLVVAAVSGVVMAVMQAATQIQDPTLSHLPRLIAVSVAIAVYGPWIGRHLAAFALRCFLGG